MRRIYVLSFLAFFFILNAGQAQMSVLFVDDSDDTYGNAELVYAALDSVGYSATYYNAVDSAAGPSDLVMQNFDLVVWSTSTDGSDLLLWNGVDEDNIALKLYLENGGKLWLLGNDFFFDRYTTNTSFASGDFAYDYLGIKSYDLQTYVDDGSIGLPKVVPSTESPITGLSDISWQFATLWYADGVSLVDDAKPVYEMGDDSYVLSGKTCGSLYSNGTFQALTYFFDLALAKDFNNVKANVEAVTTYFQGQISSSLDLVKSVENMMVYPNPATDHSKLEITLSSPTEATVYVTDITGKQVNNAITYNNLVVGKNTIELNTSGLAKGMHLVYVRFEDGIKTVPLLIQK